MQFTLTRDYALKLLLVIENLGIFFKSWFSIQTAVKVVLYYQAQMCLHCLADHFSVSHTIDHTSWFGSSVILSHQSYIARWIEPGQSSLSCHPHIEWDFVQLKVEPLRAECFSGPLQVEERFWSNNWGWWEVGPDDSDVISCVLNMFSFSRINLVYFNSIDYEFLGMGLLKIKVDFRWSFQHDIYLFSVSMMSIP